MSGYDRLALLILIINLVYFPIVYQAVLLSASDNRHPLIRLDSSQGNEFSGAEGVVQVWHDGVWNYINGSAWDYPDATVACRELGMATRG